MSEQLIQEYVDLQAEFDMLNKNKQKLAGKQFTNTQDLSRLRLMIEPLLLRIHLHGDMEARAEYDDVKREMEELKDLAKHLPSLLSQADAEVSAVQRQLDAVKQKIERLEDRRAYWISEKKKYEDMITRNPLRADELQEKLDFINSHLK